MTNYRRADLSKVKTLSVRARRTKVELAGFARPFDETRDSFDGFVDGLPGILVAQDLKDLVAQIVAAKRKGRPVILMMGAHVIKVGLAPVLIDLLRRNVITGVAMNSASAIHDVECAMWGRTSEDVAANLRTGRFGMVRETAELINFTLAEAFRGSDMGYGEALGKKLVSLEAPNAKVSILAACYALNIPLTVHAAIGTDTIHQQPSMDGAVTGGMSFRDFQLLCGLCRELKPGSVVLNVGSAVIMPEVFLKALTVARNLGAKATGFTTAVFDMHAQYRPTVNVMTRPTQDGGRGYYFIGHHEIMIPLLAAMIKAGLRKAPR